eukprot:scaffold216327_cov31-Tisochrysis_lutea.AAC.1
MTKGDVHVRLLPHTTTSTGAPCSRTFYTDRPRQPRSCCDPQSPATDVDIHIRLRSKHSWGRTSSASHLVEIARA